MSRLRIINPAAATEALAEMQFETVGNFNSGQIGVFWSEAGGPGPWEMHPDEDELLHIVEGKVEIEVLPSDPAQAGERVVMKSGDFFVVPRGLWHRHHILDRAKEMYLSPATTLHSNDDNPR